MRIARVLPALLALTTACDGSIASGSADVFASTQDVAGKQQAFLFGRVSANRAAREQMDSIDVDVALVGEWEEGSEPSTNVRVSVQNGREGVALASASGTATATWTNVPFKDCTDEGFFEDQSGTCNTTLRILMESDRPIEFLATQWIYARSETFEGDASGIVVTSSIEVAD